MFGIRRTIVTIISLMIAVLGFGTVGYIVLEGWSFLDSLYMTAITLSTVGFGEIRPLSDLGRIFTVVLIFTGIGTIAYGLSSLGEFLVSSDLGPTLRKRRSMRMISKMKNHVVICGYGRVGRSAVSSLLKMRDDVVVVDRSKAVVEEIRQKGIPVIHGDATNDDVLRDAGLERASSLMICGGNDADNLFIVLSARTMNPSLTIVARSVDQANESKMVRAGANRVISPYQIGGRFMATVLTRPSVTDFFQQVTLESGLELWLEEVEIQRGSRLSGTTVLESAIRKSTGVSLVGLMRKSTGETLTPDPTTIIEAEDVLIVIGTREQLAKLEELAEVQATN